MGLRKLLMCTLLLATASAQSLSDPWLRDPQLVGLWKLTRAINSFGFNLFKDLAINSSGVNLFLDLAIAAKGNVLICPYSLSTSLGIVHFGSSGETEKELAEVLGYEAVNLTKDEAAQVFYMLSTKHLKSSNPEFYLFDAPSTIMVNRNNGVLRTFRRVVEVLFQAPITVSRSMESAEDLTRSVNDWIAARTRNTIQHILEYVDPYSDMILVSAAYFRGEWVHKFSPQETQSKIFYNYGSRSEPKSVHMMRMMTILKYHKGRLHSIVELPFKGRNVSMFILLPNKLDGIRTLHCRFSPEFFEEQLWKMTPYGVDIVLPKFQIEFAADLTENLKGLGAEALFRSEKVDLSEMVRRGSVTFGEVRHQTTLSVIENGVEVTPASSVINFDPFPARLEIPNFQVDHPFWFVIYERRIKMILLMGSVMEL